MHYFLGSFDLSFNYCRFEKNKNTSIFKNTKIKLIDIYPKWPKQKKIYPNRERGHFSRIERGPTLKVGTS